MLVLAGRNPVVGKQPLEVARSRTVEAETNRGGYRTAQQVDAHRCVHAQGHVEVPAPELLAYRVVGAATCRLIENDKLDVRYLGHQRCLGFANDPGNPRVGPVVLQTTNNGQRMAGIADRRKAHDADVLRFRWNG